MKRKDKKAKQAKQQDLVRVIVISSDASRDYFIPKELARSLYRDGKLAWDTDNHEYTEIVAGKRTIYNVE